MSIFSFYETLVGVKHNQNTISFSNSRLEINFDNKIFYLHNEEEFELSLNSIDGIDDCITYKLIDDEYIWDEESFILNVKFSLNNFKDLFSFGGLVYEDAVIGVGIEWKSNKSRIKKTHKLGVFSTNDTTVSFDDKIKIDEFNSDVKIEICFYIHSIGAQKHGGNLANKKGLVVFNTPILQLKKSGNGSSFPIVDIVDPKGPLWKVSHDYIDIYEDEFSEENVKIMINKSNNAYQFIMHEHRNYNHSFSNEVLSSALSVLLTSILIKEDWNIDFERNAAEGSIAIALRYFKEQHKFDFSSVEDLTISIKNFFDKGLK